MISEILVCLDGSPFAEKIAPLARAVAGATGATLTGLQVIKHFNDMSGAENYMRDFARRFGTGIKFAVSSEPASAILEELGKNPTSIAALTTHGRTALSEAVLGSVAFQVIRGAKRPVILYCPLVKDADAPKKLNTLVVALDGSDFSEKIIPYAAEWAKALAIRLLLNQALPVQAPMPPGPDRETVLFLESSYLHRKAAAIKQAHGIDADWEVLHGDPADAICRYLKGMPDTLLAMTTHARSAVERAMLGSVAGYCVRHTGVPLLLYWPDDQSLPGKLGVGPVSAAFL
jgi:nucleotide-binding universal stress UspA family protein